MDTSEGERRICPTCGHSNIPSATFCAQCGRPIDEDAPSDAQTTSVYAPIGGDDAAAARWGAPSADDTIIDVDPGQTTTFPVGGRFSFDDEPGTGAASVSSRRNQGIRGLILGIIAAILIAVVIGFYVYSAWLSVSMRDSIDGWIPWIS